MTVAIYVSLKELCHDVGKLISKRYEDGKVNYRGHEGESKRVLDIIADRLKLSNEQKEAIPFAAENHMIGHKMDELKKSKLLTLRQNKNWDVLKHTIWADEASRGPTLFDPKEYEDKMNKAETLAHQFGQKQDFEKKIAGFVNGQLIMTLIPGIKGPDIGIIKNQVRDWIVQNDFKVAPKEVKEYIEDRARELNYKI